MQKKNVPGYYPYGEFSNVIKHWKNMNHNPDNLGSLIFCRKEEREMLAADAKKFVEPGSHICLKCSKCI